MALTLGSAHLSDDEFLAAFHNCSWPIGQFHHADHLRLAWLHLHRECFDIALDSIRNGIRRFAVHHLGEQRAAALYHETVTQAWIRLLATHNEPSFADFLSANQSHLNQDLLYRFWTPETLQSRDAQGSWIAPDRQSLPDQSGLVV